MVIIYIAILLYLSPLFVAYFMLYSIARTFPVGEKKLGTGQDIHISSDLIHSDYVFKSEQIKSLFPTNKRFVKVGWGDRKIFLETKRWQDLKLLDFLGALFGMNETVLRVEYLNELPKNSKRIQMDDRQLEIVLIHIKESFFREKIENKPSYFPKGEYYKSNLRYSCIKNCNNWVNYGLYLGKVTNVVWCPFSFLI